ncbi:MAG TPA: anti-sigma factor [Pyrinomonadaceae bacterium]|nr:anti-sigma factor [Pyrinomonadaceae bacterium]
MSCQRAEDWIHGYLDGELDLARNLEVEQHMRECEICARSYRTQTTLRSSLKGESLYYGAPEKLKKRIQSSLRKEAKSEMLPRAFEWRWLRVGASVAFILLIGVVVWRLVPRSVPPSGDELLAQEIVSDHVRSLQMPGHLTDVLSSDQHTVKPWFDGKVDFAPPVKDFASQDFHLYGGRLEYLNNRTVATLIYQRRLHYINLYIWPAEQAGATGEMTTQRQGYNLAHWISSGMNYWAISDLNRVELQEFARLVQQGQ